MSKNAPAETPVETSPVKTSSKKREITAAVTSTTVTVLLGLVATAVIDQVGQRVKSAIAPKTETEE